MGFWDASAIVPLLVLESPTDHLLDLLEEDPAMIVWWGAPVECTSAIARREREGALTATDATTALERLSSLSTEWHEVQPVDPVRRTAQRLLRVHPLRSADSLHLFQLRFIKTAVAILVEAIELHLKATTGFLPAHLPVAILIHSFDHLRSPRHPGAFSHTSSFATSATSHPIAP